MTKFSTLIFFLMVTSILTAQDWITPVIEGYGKIKHFEEVAEQPDATLEYNLVFDVTGDREMEGVNLGLWKIARVINMLGAAKIPKDKIHIVAAIHGPATFTTLNAEKYQEKYQKVNPNNELLQLLDEYGVDLYVCAQATASRGYGAADLNSNTKLALSAMSVLANYQLRGYALMP